jgi:transcriptional regulator with XRE-family HTH domain
VSQPIAPLPVSRNQRLYDAIRKSGMRREYIAEAVGVDPKTVDRWIVEGRLPRPAIRQQLAQLVGVPEAVLWPDAPGIAYGTSELVGIYATRRELPPATVSSLLNAAERQIDVLAYAALWLWETVPGFVETLELKIGREAKVRICLGDPTSQAVELRGQEEGVAADFPGRCRLAPTTRGRSTTSTRTPCASAQRRCMPRSSASMMQCY